MLYLTIFFLSLSSLSFEIMLARFFLISQWSHMSFMVISIALLGYAASGRFSHKITWRGRYNPLLLIYSITTVFSYFFLNLVPIDFFRILTNRLQLVYLATTYVVLAIPFFISGLVISTAYSFNPENSGKIYLANMTGSAIGVALPFFLLGSLSEGETVLLSGLLPLIAVFAERSTRGNITVLHLHGRIKSLLPKFAGILLITFSLLTLYTNYNKLANFRVSPYKALSQILKFPNTRVIKRKVNIAERADLIESPYVRFAPGLSLSYTKPIKGGKTLVLNGDVTFSLPPFSSKAQKVPTFPGYTLSFAGYTLLHTRKKTLNRALVIERGGGLGLLSAVSEIKTGKLKKADILVNSKELYEVLSKLYLPSSTSQDHPTYATETDHIRIIHENPRAYTQNLANRNSKKQPSSQYKYEFIQIENWGSSVPGMASTSEESLFTINALSSYLKILSTRGILLISRKLILPPSDSIRILLTALKALSLSDSTNHSPEINTPQNHIAALRNWDTYIVIISKCPLSTTDISTLKSFAKRMSFDFIYYPGIKRAEVNKFNIYKHPFFYEEFNRFLKKSTRSETLRDYLKRYYLDVAPQSDARPFQNRFIKITGLPEYFKSTGERPYKLLMSGEVIVIAVFAEALILSLFILLVPLSNRKKEKIPLSNRINWEFRKLYFFLVGCGFMFVEIALIKMFTLIIGNPIISFSIVLFVILTFSGIGGKLSESLRRVKYPLLNILLVALLLLLSSRYLQISQYMLSLSKLWRLCVSILLIVPISLTMGFAFPAGVKHLTLTQRERSYAWSVNGIASVLTAVISEYIAFSQGIDKLILLGAFSYLGILVIWRLIPPPHTTSNTHKTTVVS